jgi:outer membrane protein
MISVKNLAVKTILAIGLVSAVSATSPRADTQFLALTPTYIPNYFGLGAGSYPDYIGSDDSTAGVAPFGRLTFGEQRYVSLEVNYLSINLLEDRNWRFGPAGMWRFGRDDVDDPVVSQLPDIDASLEIGMFGAYEFVGEDPRDRWWIGGNLMKGITGDNDGYTLAASVRRWMPVGRSTALGFSLGTTYGTSDYMDTFFSVDAGGAAASGLDAFSAGAGVRDVRVTVALMQPLSREWVIGAGFLYSRLLNDAADSPIVSVRGDRDQLVFGIGVARAF